MNNDQENKNKKLTGLDALFDIMDRTPEGAPIDAKDLEKMRKIADQKLIEIDVAETNHL